MEAEGLGAETRPRTPMSRVWGNRPALPAPASCLYIKGPCSRHSALGTKQGELKAAVSPGDSRGQGVPGAGQEGAGSGGPQGPLGLSSPHSLSFTGSPFHR